MEDYISHRHLCEIKLFNRDDTYLWKSECPYKKCKTDSGIAEACDECSHLIIVTFLDKGMTRANSIIRKE